MLLLRLLLRPAASMLPLLLRLLDGTSIFSPRVIAL